ncbi:hypothetical protein RDB90_004262 [Salmonella enterica]|nr:hypothetical protein [Salmonella enterica]EEI9428999.1 hypothetical protein [Salmonella enterica subsp. diarizonae]EBR5147206.1 hypothetical protein [Salmonella enterica]EBT6048122.1 hypothetical protein [Salmonella enterica]EIZ7356488.1 hypothetical protein [Salmonella enterica]
MNPTYTALVQLLRAGAVCTGTDASQLNGVENTQITVRLRPETRIFFDVCSERLGVSRTVRFNLMVDGLMAQTLDNTSHKAVTLYERFCLLMDAHGLDVMEQVCLLKPWGFRSGLLASCERTLDLLSIPLLQQLAGWFYVDVDWLRGRTACPVCVPDGDGADNWSAVTEHLRALPGMDDTSSPVELIFCFVRRAAGEPVRDVGLCLRYRRLTGEMTVPVVRWYGMAAWQVPYTQEEFRRLQSLACGSARGEPLRTPPESYPRIRCRYFRLSARQMQGLARGEVLPVMILNHPQGEYPGI